MMNLPLNPTGKLEQAEIGMREIRREIETRRLARKMGGRLGLLNALRVRLGDGCRRPQNADSVREAQIRPITLRSASKLD
jgi:hypothetical protein